MNLSERRRRLRQIFGEQICVGPASVFDPFSARSAAALGFEMMMMAGSVASGTVLGAPDLVVLTLTEFAEQIRRVTRVSDLPLLVDADHGYGNALNVMRCVEELEAAGVAALTIEDTALPRPFGAKNESAISVEEACGKMRAAVAARSDPELLVLGRTSTVRFEGLDRCIERVRAYAETGVDGIFFAGMRTRQELEALRAATSLPFLLGNSTPELEDTAYLASQGVRVRLLGHAPFQNAARAAYETLRSLRPDPGPVPDGLLAALMAQAEYDHDIAAYLMP